VIGHRFEADLIYNHSSQKSYHFSLFLITGIKLVQRISGVFFNNNNHEEGLPITNYEEIEKNLRNYLSDHQLP
jgi:hypothetical protein